jgi:hypothetical protein
MGTDSQRQNCRHLVVSLTNPRLENFANGGAVGLTSGDDTRVNSRQLTPEHIDITEDDEGSSLIFVEKSKDVRLISSLCST